jgi:hypothetical protein
MSVVDWLERSPELPPNVRLVLSSRPHPPAQDAGRHPGRKHRGDRTRPRVRRRAR